MKLSPPPNMQLLVVLINYTQKEHLNFSRLITSATYKTYKISPLTSDVILGDWAYTSDHCWFWTEAESRQCQLNSAGIY